MAIQKKLGMVCVLKQYQMHPDITLLVRIYCFKNSFRWFVRRTHACTAAMVSFSGTYFHLTVCTALTIPCLGPYWSFGQWLSHTSFKDWSCQILLNRNWESWKQKINKHMQYLQKQILSQSEAIIFVLNLSLM